MRGAGVVGQAACLRRWRLVLMFAQRLRPDRPVDLPLVMLDVGEAGTVGVLTLRKGRRLPIRGILGLMS
jgi:hypothetical protein